MTDTVVLLAERGSTHGPYSLHAEITQRLTMTMAEAGYKNWTNLSHAQKEALHMIAHKIGRILAGNPDYADHWDDIAGYAKLVSNEIGKR